MKKLYLPILILAAFLTSCNHDAIYDTEIYLGHGVRWKCKTTYVSHIKTPHFECDGTLKVCDMGDVSTLYDLMFMQHISQTLVAYCNDGTTHWNVTNLETKFKPSQGD